MTDVRYIAYETLLLVTDGEYTGEPVKDVLNKYSYLNSLDRSFLKRLIEGTIERMITVDHVIGQFSKVPVKKMKKQVRCLLRMGTYQLLFMDSVSDYAAVDETVKLIRKTHLYKLSGFVNAVLRNISRNKDNIRWPDKDSDIVKYMSVTYSCPEWIASMLISERGIKEVEALLGLSVSVRPITARVNTSRVSVEEALSQCVGERSDVYENAIVLSEHDDISQIPAFLNGNICIQDISSMLVCAVAGIKKCDTVLDLCAAPGGKSMHAADIATDGRVVSCDVSERKTALIDENIQRCGFTNVTTRINDASVYNEDLDQAFDVVLADVPCSGLGVMGRKNDIKYNITPEAIADLSALQKKILKNAALYVKPGGTLMFSTCTCTHAENEDNVRFLTEECKLTPADFYEELPAALRKESAKSGYLQLIGEDALTDGFFIGKFRK